MEVTLQKDSTSLASQLQSTERVKNLAQGEKPSDEKIRNDSKVSGGDFSSLMMKLLGGNETSTVNEEELFAGLIGQRLQKLDKEASDFYAAEKAKLMVSMARSDGYIPVEDVAKAALKATVTAGKIDQTKAEEVNAEAFAAAQLDDKLDVLFDGRGGGDDHTIATADMKTALSKMEEMVKKIENGEMKLEARSLDIPSNGKTGGSPTRGSSSLAGLQNLDGSGGFLWKPESERDGNLAVLLPSELAGIVDRLEIHTANPPTDSSKIAEGRLTGNTNGDRPTFRFDKSGGEYGDDIYAVAYRSDGEKVIWKITDGAERND